MRRLCAGVRAAESVAVAPAFLGLLHGLVSAIEQLLGVFAVLGKNRDADAGRNVNRIWADSERLIECGQYLLHHHQGVRYCSNSRQQDHELVAADPCKRIRFAPQTGVYACRRLLQQQVADVAAEGVVDRLGNEISSDDREYIGKFNSSVKESGSSVDLFLGTNNVAFSGERGGLLKGEMDLLVGNYYSYIQSWTRGGVSNIIEKLLLRTIQANYQNKTISLTMNLKEVSPPGYVTSSYFTGKKLMITACKNDLAEASSEIECQEIIGETGVTIV